MGDKLGTGRFLDGSFVMIKKTPHGLTFVRRFRVWLKGC